MSNSSSPLSQFEIKPLIDLKFANYDLSFTNSSLFMLLTIVAAYLLFTIPMRNSSLIPNRGQNICELMYEFIDNIINDTIGIEGKRYLPFIFSVFIFVLGCNLLGLMPYGFTVTSHISVNLGLAVLIFIVVNVIAFSRHGWHFFSFFLPSGVPRWLAPLIIIIELFTYLVRPLSLAIRLAANMIAGHILLKIIAGFAVMMGVLWAWLPVGFAVMLTGLELFVAILQAYIFTILTCIYLNDAINLH